MKPSPTKVKQPITDEEAAVTRHLVSAPLSHKGNKKAWNIILAYLRQRHESGDITGETVRVALLVHNERVSSELSEMCDFICNRYLDSLLSRLPESYAVPEGQWEKFKQEVAA